MFHKIEQGTAGIFPAEELKKKLSSGKMLKIKFGIDPTTPDIHLGHCVVLRKLRDFQDLGHKVVLIIGDFTALIGDPSGRDKTRPVLTWKEIKENARTYVKQACKILLNSSDYLEIRHNESWFDEMILEDAIELFSNFTAQQLWHRESFKRRADTGIEVNMTEFLYPMLQAFDSYIIKADVEIGGTDQTFNMQRGRDLMIKKGMEPQVVVTMPILIGLDGKEKMSKSKGNHVALTDNPRDMFGKLMSIPDNLIDTYIKLLLNNFQEAIEHPMKRKEAMAHCIVEMFHGKESAIVAHDDFIKMFSKKVLPEEVEVKFTKPGLLVNIIADIGFAPSRTQARKLIEAGAVKMDGEKVENTHIIVNPTGQVIQVGKRKVCRIKE